MTIEEFERFILTKSVGRTSISKSENIIERTYSAMKRVARDCVPLDLTQKTKEGIQVMKRIDNDLFLAFPKRPIAGSGHDLDMEEDLIDAVAYLVLAGLEIQLVKRHMHNYYVEVEDYNDKISTEYLEYSSNNHRRYGNFP